MEELRIELGRSEIAKLFHLMLMVIAFHFFAEHAHAAINGGISGANRWNVVVVAIFLLTAVRFVAGNAYWLHRRCGPAAPPGYRWWIDLGFIFIEALVFIYIAQSLEHIALGTKDHHSGPFWAGLLTLFGVDFCFAASSIARRRHRDLIQRAYERPTSAVSGRRLERAWVRCFLGLRRFYWWLRRRPVPKVRTEEKTAASVESERFLERYWVLFSLWLLLTTAWAWHGVAATDKVDMDPIFLLLFSSVGLCVWDLNLIMADESRLRPGSGRSGALGRYAIKAGLSIWDLPLIKGNKNRRRPVMGPAAPLGGALGHYEIMARLCIWDLPQIVEDWRRKPSEHGGELGRYDIAAFFHLTLMAIAFHLFAKAGCEAVAAGCLSAIVIFLLTAVRFLAGNAYHLYRWCGPGAPDGYHWSIDFALIFLEALVFIYLAQSIGRIWPEKQELWHDEFWPALFALFVIDLVFAGSTVVRGIRRWRSESPSARRGAIQFLGALRAYWADRERSKDLRVASKWTGFSLVLGALTLWAWPFGGNTKPIAFVILMLASLVIGVWDMYSIMDAVGAIASKPEAAPAPESAAAPASGAAPAA